MKPIISINEARKLLGKEAENMTDEQVIKLIEQTHEMAKLALSVAKDKLAKEKRDEIQYRTTSTGKLNQKSNTQKL